MQTARQLATGLLGSKRVVGYYNNMAACHKGVTILLAHVDNLL